LEPVSWDSDPDTTSLDMAAARAVDVVGVIFRISLISIGSVMMMMIVLMDDTSRPHPGEAEQR
jgi:hypothetical protein